MKTMLNPDQELTTIQQIPNQDINDMYEFLKLINWGREPNFRSWVFLRSKKPNQNHEQAEKPSQELPISSKAPLRTWGTKSVEEAQFGPLVHQE